MRGAFSGSFRRGRGLRALTWPGSRRAAWDSAVTPSTSTAVKGAKGSSSSFSAIWVKRWYPPGLSTVVAMVMGQMPHRKSLSILKKSAPPE